MRLEECLVCQQITYVVLELRNAYNVQQGIREWLQEGPAIRKFEARLLTTLNMNVKSQLIS